MDMAGSPRLEEWNTFYYDPSWRLLEERVYESASDTDDWGDVEIAKIIQRLWGLAYIDELVSIAEDGPTTGPTPPDGDLSSGAVFRYTLRDRKHDVVALLTGAGVLLERVHYTPYGVARVGLRSDFNQDGSVDGADQAIILAAWGKTIGAAGYNVELDMDLDGAINGADFSGIFLSDWADQRPPDGVVSQFGNTIGYAGYVYDPAIDHTLSRHRWLDATTGRWVNRDILEYADGGSLYEYVRSNALGLVDPTGLFSNAEARRIQDERQSRALTRLREITRTRALTATEFAQIRDEIREAGAGALGVINAYADAAYYTREANRAKNVAATAAAGAGCHGRLGDRATGSSPSLS